MPPTKKIGHSSRKAKASLRQCAHIARVARQSNKENIPPKPHHSHPVNHGSTYWQSRVYTTTKRLKTTQRALQREKYKSVKLSERVKVSTAREKDLFRRTSLAFKNFEYHNQWYQQNKEYLNAKLGAVIDKLLVTRNRVKALKEKLRRFMFRVGHDIDARSKSATHIWRLRRKGIYTTQARNIARSLVHAGCAPKKVSEIINSIAGAVGVKVEGNISARTVQRAQLEGLVASDIQIGYELSGADSVTLSQDSTSNRHVNFESHHIALQVPNYSQGEVIRSHSSAHKVRMLRLDSTLDHSSETSHQKWLHQLSDLGDTYNSSPLAMRQSTQFSLRHFALILKGMNGDHASAEKGTAKLMEAWKKEETLVGLGEQKLQTSNISELISYLGQKKVERVENYGGSDKWNAMTVTEQCREEECLLKNIKIELGNEVYMGLPDYERRMLDLFIWAGCCMHKDLNSFKGGNTVMGAYWKKHGLDEPIPLANKFNAPKIRSILDPSRSKAPVTPDELLTLENTTRGGAKTAAIAGAIFNNKDDKKGYGDTYQIFRESIDLVNQVCSRFPDTSNTRFNSHAEAAAELLKHLSFYLRFLEHIRDAKKQPGWTNIEINLYNALRDIPTLTELAAMVLYAQSVTHPYLRYVRGPGTEKLNILDLVPLHTRVRSHCELIAANPDLLIASDVSYEHATLDGKKWESPSAIEAIQKLIPILPHLHGAVQAFFDGALSTWIRFTSEFAPGGLIDTANAEEKRLAWMPSTNDTNEGALGAYRVYMRNKPSTTSLQYNAYAVWERNDTQSFINALFTEEDEAYIRRKARDWDSQGREKERKKELREFSEKQVALRREKEEKKQRVAKERHERLLRVVISSQGEGITFLTVAEIDGQLDTLREIYGDTEVPKKTARGRKSDKIKFLEEAITRFDCQKKSAQSLIEKNLTQVVISYNEEDEIELEMEDYSGF